MPKAPATKGKKATPKASRKAKPAPNAKAAAAPTPRPVPAAAPAPPRRLGEDLVAAAPGKRPTREPMSIVIARTDIVAGGVRIKAQGPSVVRVPKGQVVHVKHAYRLQEHSPQREEYRFLLKTTLNGRSPPPSLARHGDQWGVPEDINGYLQHEHTLTQPGTHRLEFEASAEYCVMGWSDTTVQALDRKDLKGTLDLIVG